MIEIPIYRAKKKIGSDEYITGILLPELKRFNGKSYIISDYTRMQDFDNAVEIDVSTLSIHFPDMLDSKGNKIFASLSEDGKGGDRVWCKWRTCNGDDMESGAYVAFKKTLFVIMMEIYRDGIIPFSFNYFNSIETIGIEQDRL